MEVWRVIGWRWLGKENYLITNYQLGMNCSELQNASQVKLSFDMIAQPLVCRHIPKFLILNLSTEFFIEALAKLKAMAKADYPIPN